MRLVVLQVQAHRTLVGAEEDGVARGGGAGAGAAADLELPENLSRERVEAAADLLVNLAADSVEIVTLQDELVIAVRLGPHELAAVGGDRDQPLHGRSGEVEGLVAAPQEGGGPPVRAPVLAILVFTERLEQLR